MRHLLFGVIFLLLVSYAGSGNNQSGMTALLFTIHQDRDVYDRSDYGEPPQFAIWLENRVTGEIKTVFVTYRTATGNFEGKVECPVSLPAWIGAFRKETGRDDIPTLKNPAYEAVTGATPQVKRFKTRIDVPDGSKWYYYVEVNVSGDYTAEFPEMNSDWTTDIHGNGQPSIIYKGEIMCKAGEKDTPDLIGRTEQLYLSTDIITDLNGIENAKDVFSMIKVTCIN
jgi:hypothetical protein